MLRELSRAYPGLQLQLRRGTGAEVTEYLKQGTAELAIAGPLDEPWSRLDAFPLFEEPFHLVVNRTHRLADRSRVEFSDLASDTLLINTECRSEAHTSELQSLMRISYAVFCLKKKTTKN